MYRRKDWNALLLALSTLMVNISNEVSCEKILFLLPIATKSHTNIFNPLIKELGHKGHEIFVMSSINSSGMPENVEQFVPVAVDDIFGNMGDVFASRKDKSWGPMSVNTDFIKDACHKIFQHPKTIELLATKQNYFDLIVLDILGNNCVYGMVVHLRSPVVGIITFAPVSALVENLGLHLPNSFVPNPFAPFSDKMTFSERMANFAINLIMPILSKYLYVSKMEAVYKQYLGDHMPSNAEIESNLSALLTNTHFSMNYPRPLLPEIVEIGGIHCRPARPLPTDLETFLSGDQDGFIYFSFGSIVKSENMPEEIRKTFVKVLGSLKLKVLWKWDTDKMEDLPENIKLIKWAPQQDILGHKNIRLFISHGGLLSSQEAVYHGVPVLNLPFFADQDLNSKSNSQAGFGIHLEIIGLKEEDLLESLKKLLEDPKYYQRAKELSAIFKDQPNTPLDRAVYWVEYVMRYKGAHHLRSASRNLFRFQYHSLDVIAFIIALCVTILGIVFMCVKKLLRNFNAFISPTQVIGSSKKNE